MKLFKMSESEFKQWAPQSQSAFADDKLKANSLTREEADKIASESFLRLLPLGLETKDNFLYCLKNEQSEILGYLWFRLQGPIENRCAFVCDILIEAPHRGQGLGKMVMLFAESEAKKLGANRIGLHVFGFNSVAIGLYTSLGYQTTDLVMEKPI